MTTLNTTLPVGRESIQALSRSKQEPAWLTELRLQALDVAGTLELPKLEKMKIDRWNIDHYGEYKEVAKADSPENLPEEIRILLSQDSPQSGVLIQQNSGVVYTSLSEKLKEQGVILCDLETAAREHEELVKPYLMQ